MNAAGEDAFAYACRVAAGLRRPTTGRPITDHGEHGEHGAEWPDKRCVLQDTIWVDMHGVPRQLTDMSGEDRCQVLAHLRDAAPGWVLAAYKTAVAQAIARVISPERATREIEALASLPAGWTDHTILGSALHRLNGTTPGPLALPGPPVAASDSDTPEVLHDSDTGAWTLETETSAYDLDLDRRQIRRHPRVSSGNGRYPVNHLRFDGSWTDLAALVDCAVGRPLVVLDRAVDYRRSTPVTRICRQPQPR